MKITLTATLIDAYDNPVEVNYSRTLPKPLAPEFGDENYGDAVAKADWTFAQPTVNDLVDEVTVELMKGIDQFAKQDAQRVETHNAKRAAAREQEARERAEAATS